MRKERRLLIVDDERRMADSLKSLFDDAGYQTDVAYGGTEGVAKIRDGDYQVVITDIRMPECDGYDLMRYVKENCTNTLVIAITGFVSTESVIRAIRQSAFDYIPKPYEFDMLRGTVERAFREVETRQMRDDLISMITHDIKVPLGTIIGYAQIALEGSDVSLHPRAREFLELISINGQRILSLVDNFLTTCRVEAGRLEIVEMPLNLVETIESLRPVTGLEASKRGVAFHLRVEADQIMVAGDDNLLFRAIGNLFHNAVKYAGEHGRAEASVRIVERPGEEGTRRWGLVEVSNTGPGIAAEALSRVFERFERWGERKGSDGAGLGLYVVRCIVEAHRGHLEVESRPGEMTVFRVYFPLADPASMQPPS